MDKPLRRSLTEILEVHGIDNKFLNRIGIEFKLSAVRGKHSVKIYIPPHQLEMFQVFAIYQKMNQTSISSWTRDIMLKKIKELLSTDDPMLNEAKLLHKELKEKRFLEMLNNQKKSKE